MKAELADNLVTPGTSAATILSNCRSGKYGAPHAIDERSAESVVEHRGDQQEQAILKSVSIENFRAYRRRKEFHLGSALTVLYGPNGFGKTSFFDAVDFVVTGGVGRFDRPVGGLSKVAKHLDSGDDPTSVSLTFERSGQTHFITRNLVSPNDATLDGEPATRKAILNKLTGGESAPTDRVDNLVSLFRATHLFSQDRQELTGKVAESCALPADIVSRMLAFDDYVNGLKKVNDVFKLAKVEHERWVGQARSARSEIDKDAKEIKRLEGLLSSTTSTEALDSRFDELEAALSIAGFSLEGVSIRDTRALRASLEATALEASSRRARLESCLTHVTNLRSLNSQGTQLRANLNDTKTVAEKADADAADAARRVTTAASDASQTESLAKEASNLCDWQTWAISVKPETAQLTTECQAHADRLAALADQLKIQREALSRAEANQDSAQTQVRAAEDKATVETDKRVRVQQAKKMLELANSVSPQVIEVRSTEARIQEQINVQRAKVHEAEQALLTQRLLVVQIERELTTANSNASKVKGLVAELRSHVQGSECLLCGHDHGSSQALLAAIDQQMEQADLVVQLGERLMSERETQRQLDQRLQSYKDILAQDEQKLRTAQSQRQRLEHELVECRNAFSTIGLSIDDAPAEKLAEAIVQSTENERKAIATINVAKEALFKAQTELTKTRQQYGVIESEQKSASQRLIEAKSRLDEILNEARRGAIDLSVALQVLQSSLVEQETRLKQLNESHHVTKVALESHRASQSAAAGAATAAKAAQQAALRAWNSYQADMQLHITALSSEGLNIETPEEHVLLLMKEAEARALAATGLRDKTAELEVAADAVATSAAFQSIRIRIDNNESIAMQAEEQAILVQPWIAYFEGISKLLSGQQAVATEHFTTEYGPRTEVIQRRLRPVYGFDDIKVSSTDSSIQIHVRRNDEELRPTDFFSQSQVQTLVLGLFLTACSSQTWSGFSSIMMDDPVTHFDDLNTYALLDLISGLQESPEGARQFVISTCDEKLLQLARHKFRHLGDAAKFYRFSAIGAEGPLVAEIPG
jgi:exonuclease SbcC